MKFLKRNKKQEKEGKQENKTRHFLVTAKLYAGRKFIKEEILHIKTENSLLFNEQTEKLRIYKSDYAKSKKVNSVRFSIPSEFSEADCVNFKKIPDWLKEHREEVTRQQKRQERPKNN